MRVRRLTALREPRPLAPFLPVPDFEGLLPVFVAAALGLSIFFVPDAAVLGLGAALGAVFVAAVLGLAVPFAAGLAAVLGVALAAGFAAGFAGAFGLAAGLPWGVVLAPGFAGVWPEACDETKGDGVRVAPLVLLVAGLAGGLAEACDETKGDGVCGVLLAVGFGGVFGLPDCGVFAIDRASF